jgi:pimeloyl-ACP methyl ester carboxylesterase
LSSSRSIPCILTCSSSVVAAHLAAERSDRVVATILIGPVYPSETFVPIFEKRIELVEKGGMDPLANSLPFSAPAKSASPIVRSFIRELLLGQDPAGYISHCRILINAKPPVYGKINVPVLIIAGEEDKTAPVEGCQKMFDEMNTEKKLEILKAVGHWQCLEDFAEVGKQILNFYHDIQ